MSSDLFPEAARGSVILFFQIAQIVHFLFCWGISLLLPDLELYVLSCLGALLDRLQVWNMEQFAGVLSLSSFVFSRISSLRLWRV